MEETFPACLPIYQQGEIGLAQPGQHRLIDDALELVKVEGFDLRADFVGWQRGRGAGRDFAGGHR
ncbi:MAG: hypothetical protein U5Q16_17275 [Gammaproteobacteria bacterium]|nr:hypothetical protein [Gammaproteobacteria bacterium]